MFKFDKKNEFKKSPAIPKGALFADGGSSGIIENNENLEIVKIPKIIDGSFSDKPGEAGFISYTTNPNFLAVPELYKEISELTTDLEMAGRQKVVAILKPKKEKVFFGVSSPAYTRFPTVNRTYNQASITFADSNNPSAGNIFSNSKMFGEYTKAEFENNQKKIRAGENVSSEIEVKKPVEIPEKLLLIVEEYLKNGKKLFIENNEKVKLEGNEILDYLPVKTLLCLYDKLTPELKKEYSLYIGSFTDKSSKSNISFILEPLTEQEKDSHQRQGYSVLKWNDLVY
ncbi:MAG: hypothetical protein V4439_01205 [Patescibacteria group bacterium]